MDTTNNNVLCEEKDIIDIAEAIRSKTNDTNTMYVSEMANKIISIQGGEDVTEETNAYTDKIASLESAVTALETELQGKASGGGGSSGGTLQMTTGTFTPSDKNLYDNPIVVSGLGFRPKYVFVHGSTYIPVGYYLGTYPSKMLGGIFGGDSDVPAIAIYLTATSQSAPLVRLYTVNDGIYNITFNDDGFTVTATESTALISTFAPWTYYVVG